MDFKIIKQLQQKKWLFHRTLKQNRISINSIAYIEPSVEELIIACGNKFDSLYRNENRWFAKARSGLETLTVCETSMSNAIALLWCVLQEIDNDSVV